MGLAAADLMSESWTTPTEVRKTLASWALLTGSGKLFYVLFEVLVEVSPCSWLVLSVKLRAEDDFFSCLGSVEVALGPIGEHLAL